MTRIYLPREAIESGERGGAMELDAETSKKLLKVLRLSPGEMFVGFDGFGREWDCALLPPDEDNPKSKIARAALIAEREEAAPRRLHLSVAQAIPKGDKWTGRCKRAPNLASPNSGRLSPRAACLNTTTTAHSRAPNAGAKSRQRRRRNAGAPMCQLFTRFPSSPPSSIMERQIHAAFFDELGETGALRTSLEKEPVKGDEDAPARAMIIVGPEGGWTERERDWATRYGAEAVGLGRLVLRTETAALVAATVLQWEAGELD